MNHQLTQSTFGSSLIVFAEKVQQERLARRNYLSLLKRGTEEQKKSAREKLQTVESEVDAICAGVLIEQTRPQRQNLREGVLVA